MRKPSWGCGLMKLDWMDLANLCFLCYLLFKF